MRKNAKIAALLAMGMVFSVNLSAASFNCAKASNKIEHAICNDKELSALDSEMGKLYKQIHNESWRTQHKNMVKMRNKACNKDKDPTHCLKKWINDEIKELHREIRLGG